MSEPTEFQRMMAAAQDSPGAWIKRGNMTVHCSKARITNPKMIAVPCA